MRVFLVAAATVCGRIGPVPIGSPVDRRHLERMREATGASLMGAGTFRSGDPEMRGLDGHLPPGRIRAVITRSGDIPVDGRRLLSTGPPPVFFTGQETAGTLDARLRGRAKVVGLPEGPDGLSIQAALDHLARLGADSVLIEGGGRLNYAALREGVVDEILLTLAPFISGEAGAACLADGPAPLGAPLMPLELLESKTEPTGEIFLRYRTR